MLRMLPVGGVVLLLASSCGSAPPPMTRQSQPDRETAPEPSPWADEAARGVSDRTLATLLGDHWEHTMTESPTWATELGDHRYDDRLPDESYDAVLEHREQTAEWLARARRIDPASLGADDATTLALFTEDLESKVAAAVCEAELWSISAMHNPLTEHNYLPRLHRVETVGDARNLVSRYRAMGGAIDQQVDRLRRGAERGLYANAETTRRVIAMVREQLGDPLDEWPLLAPAREAHDGFSPEVLASFRADIEAAVRDGIRPAFDRYAAFLEGTVLPNARDESHSGIGALPIGADGACYAARIREHTGLTRSAQELHDLGVTEVARIDGELRALGQRLFGTSHLEAVLARLRSDESLYFPDEAAVESKAVASLAAANARVPEWFGLVPEAPCVVVRVPEYEAAFTTIAYYRPPHPDGSKPGEYYVNVSEPRTRPRYEAAVLAYHEAVPGHHLQIAIAQELEALPAFRKHMGLTAYVEGWALYAERLADEMGLYEGDIDRMGMLSYDAWRAARLVVDTGIHALGWSREQAVSYMLAHTALAENNIRNEVDRYISWPGQALAYKVGQLEIFRLRREARERLGERFDIRGFHDAVLGGGAVTLPVLERRVQAWAARR